MKLNGGFTATVTGVMLASVLSGGAYVNRQLMSTTERLAVVETKMDEVQDRVSVLQGQLNTLEDKLGKKFESIHAGLAELLRLASPPPRR